MFFQYRFDPVKLRNCIQGTTKICNIDRDIADGLQLAFEQRIGLKTFGKYNPDWEAGPEAPFLTKLFLNFSDYHGSPLLRQLINRV